MRTTVCPACGGNEEYVTESILHSFGEDALFSNTLDARTLPTFSLINCSS
jgi:hypothetical protein